MISYLECTAKMSNSVFFKLNRRTPSYFAIRFNPHFAMAPRNYFALEGHAVEISMSLRVSANANNGSNLELSIYNVKDQASTGIVNVWHNADMNFVNGVLIQCGGCR